MINMTNVQTINVAEYFEYDQNMSLEALMRSHNLLLGDDSRMGIVNKVVSKKEAARLADELHRERNKDFSELWISSDALRVKDVRDYMGKLVFPELESDLSGWVVFFDPSTYENWDHECVYHFVVNQDCTETRTCFRAPEGELPLEKI